MWDGCPVHVGHWGASVQHTGLSWGYVWWEMGATGGSLIEYAQQTLSLVPGTLGGTKGKCGTVSLLEHQEAICARERVQSIVCWYKSLGSERGKAGRMLGTFFLRLSFLFPPPGQSPLPGLTLRDAGSVCPATLLALTAFTDPPGGQPNTPMPVPLD